MRLTGCISLISRWAQCLAFAMRCLAHRLQYSCEIRPGFRSMASRATSVSWSGHCVRSASTVSALIPAISPSRREISSVGLAQIRSAAIRCVLPCSHRISAKLSIPSHIGGNSVRPHCLDAPKSWCCQIHGMAAVSILDGVVH